MDKFIAEGELTADIDFDYSEDIKSGEDFIARFSRDKQLAEYYTSCLLLGVVNMGEANVVFEYSNIALECLIMLMDGGIQVRFLTIYLPVYLLDVPYKCMSASNLYSIANTVHIKDVEGYTFKNKYIRDINCIGTAELIFDEGCLHDVEMENYITRNNHVDVSVGKTHKGFHNCRIGYIDEINSNILCELLQQGNQISTVETVYFWGNPSIESINNLFSLLGRNPASVYVNSLYFQFYYHQLHLYDELKKCFMENVVNIKVILVTIQTDDMKYKYLKLTEGLDGLCEEYI